MTAPTDRDDDAIRARLADLEAENERLVRAAGTGSPRPRRRVPWRSIGSAVCIVLAAILLPVSLVAGWARAELTDETRFVATFGPLAQDAAVQDAVIDTTVAAIEDHVDLAGLTDALFDGIEELGVPAEASAALTLLRAPAAQGLSSMVRSGVSEFVRSDLFADVWSTTLLYSHRGLVSALTASSPTDAVVIDSSGQVVIQLGPVLDEATDYLAARGLPFVANLPTMDAIIVVAQSDGLVAAGMAYGVVTTVGFWLPVLTVALLLAGIAIARRRRTAVVGAGVGVALGAAVFLIAAAVGASVVSATAADAGAPTAAVGAAYDHVLAGMRASAVELLVVALIAALLAAATGSTRLRAVAASVNAGLRSATGLSATSAAPWQSWLDRQRTIVRAAIVAAAVAVVVVFPLTAGGIVLTATVALIVWWAVSLLETPDHPDAPAAGTRGLAREA